MKIFLILGFFAIFPFYVNGQADTLMSKKLFLNARLVNNADTANETFSTQELREKNQFIFKVDDFEISVNGLGKLSAGTVEKQLYLSVSLDRYMLVDKVYYAVVGDQLILFLMYDNGDAGHAMVYSFSRTDLKEKWTNELPWVNWLYFEELDDNLLCIGSMQKFYIVNVNTGEIIWSPLRIREIVGTELYANYEVNSVKIKGEVVEFLVSPSWEKLWPKKKITIARKSGKVLSSITLKDGN